MRISIEFNAHGETISDVVTNATDQWRKFTADIDATLPHDTEISIEQHATDDLLLGTVFTRMKVDTNG